MLTITLEDHGPPIVRILGTTLRRAAAQPGLAKRMEKLKGRVALQSTVDPQAATIHFDKGAVRVDHGVHPDADVVIRADLNTMGRPGSPKPKVTGAARHLALALGAAKVLDPPTPDGWRGEADAFWTWASDRPGRPDRLRLVCTDDGSEVVLGQGGGTSVEIHAPEWAMLAVLTGGDHLGAAMLEGRVRVASDFPTLAKLIGVVTQRMLGE